MRSLFNLLVDVIQFWITKILYHRYFCLSIYNISIPYNATVAVASTNIRLKNMWSSVLCIHHESCFPKVISKFIVTIWLVRVHAFTITETCSYWWYELPFIDRHLMYFTWTSHRLFGCLLLGRQHEYKHLRTEWYSMTYIYFMRAFILVASINICLILWCFIQSCISLHILWFW